MHAIIPVPGWLYVNPSENPAKQVQTLRATADLIELALKGNPAAILAYQGPEFVKESESFKKYKQVLAEHYAKLQEIAGQKAKEKAAVSEAAEKFLESVSDPSGTPLADDLSAKMNDEHYDDNDAD